MQQTGIGNGIQAGLAGINGNLAPKPHALTAFALILLKFNNMT
jgi:hypothetical protein